VQGSPAAQALPYQAREYLFQDRDTLATELARRRGARSRTQAVRLLADLI
jgi:hypothetical protein